MMNFSKWLENTAVMNQHQLSVGNGNDDWDNIDDEDGGNDDDYDYGPWGWKKMESINLQLHKWAETSQAMNPIKQIVCKYLFQQNPQKQIVRVFPGHIQLEIDWEFNFHEWSNMDNEIEAVLKRSDIYKPLGTTPDKLWTVVDSGAVYDYMMYVIIINITGRNTNTGSYLDNQTSFNTWEYVRQHWQEMEPKIKQHIKDFYYENYGSRQAQALQIELVTQGRGWDKPTGISQAFKENLWAHGIVNIQYRVLNPYKTDDPELWDSWGEERPIMHV